MADYTFDNFKSKKNEFDKIDGLHIIPLAGETEEQLEERLDAVRMLRASVQIGARPRQPARQRPHAETLAVAAKEIARWVAGLRVTVIGRQSARKGGLGGILAVGQGRSRSPG